MRRVKLRRPMAALPLLAIAAGCVPASEAPARPAPFPAASAPVQAPPPSLAEPVRADFALRGSPEQGAVIVGRAPSGTQALTLDGAPVPLAADGGFLIAFDRDAGPSALLVAMLAGGRTVERTLGIAPEAGGSRKSTRPIAAVRRATPNSNAAAPPNWRRSPRRARRR